MTTIQRAGLHDLGQLEQLLDASNAISVERSGKPAWKAIVQTLDEIEQLSRAGSFFVMRDDADGIVAAIAIDEHGQEWGEYSSDVHAIYFHKLMRNPLSAPIGAGRQLLEFTAAEARRRGKTLMRCDSLDVEGGILSYYLRLGFERRGTFIYPASHRPGVLLEASVPLFLDHNTAERSS